MTRESLGLEDLVRVVSPEAVGYLRDLRVVHDGSQVRSGETGKFVRMADMVLLGAGVLLSGPSLLTTWPDGTRTREAQQKDLCHRDLVDYGSAHFAREIQYAHSRMALLRNQQHTSPLDGKFLMDAGVYTIVDDMGRIELRFSSYSEEYTGMSLERRQQTRKYASMALGSDMRALISLF